MSKKFKITLVTFNKFGFSKLIETIFSILSNLLEGKRRRKF